MPYTQNVETALRVEDTVREAGAVPATIAVIGGKLKAGLTTRGTYPPIIQYFKHNRLRLFTQPIIFICLIVCSLSATLFL